MKTLSNGRIDARQEALRQGPSWSATRVVFVYCDGEPLRYATRPLRLAGEECAPTLMSLECSVGVLAGGPWAPRDPGGLTATFSNVTQDERNLDALDRQGRLVGAVVRAGVALTEPDCADADGAIWLGRWRVDRVETSGGRIVLRARSLRHDLSMRSLGRTITAEQWPRADGQAVGRTLPLVFGSVAGAPLLPVDVGFTSRLAAAISLWDTVLRLEDASRFPGAGFLDVEGETLYYSARDGATHRLTGVVRGYGRTAVAYHGAGAPVREVREATLFAVAGHPCRAVANVQVAGRPPGPFRVVERDLGGGARATLVALEHFPTKRERSSATATIPIRREGALPPWEWLVGARDNLGSDDQGRAETEKALRWQEEGAVACLVGARNRLHVRLASDLSDGALGDLARARVVVEVLAPAAGGWGLMVTIGGRGGVVLEAPLDGLLTGGDDGVAPTEPGARPRRAVVSFGDRLSAHPWALFDGGFEIEIAAADPIPDGEAVQVAALWLELDVHPCVEAPAPWAVTADVEGVFDKATGALVDNPAALLRDVLLGGAGLEGADGGERWPIDAESFALAEARLNGETGPDQAQVARRTVSRLVDQGATVAALVDDLCGDCHCRLMGGDALRLVVDDGVTGPTDYAIAPDGVVALTRRTGPLASAGPEEQQIAFGRTWQGTADGRWGFGASATRWNLEALADEGAPPRRQVYHARWMGDGNGTGGRGAAMELADHLLDLRLGEWSEWEATLTPQALPLEPGDGVELLAPRQNVWGWKGHVASVALERSGLLRVVAMARTPVEYCWRHDGANHLSLSPSGRWLRFQVGGRLTMAFDGAGNLYLPPLRTGDLATVAMDGPVAFWSASEQGVVAALWFGLADGPFMSLERFADGTAALRLDRGVDVVEDGADLAGEAPEGCVWRDGETLYFAVGQQVVARYRGDRRELTIAGRLVERL